MIEHRQTSLTSSLLRLKLSAWNKKCPIKVFGICKTRISRKVTDISCTSEPAWRLVTRGTIHELSQDENLVTNIECSPKHSKQGNCKGCLSLKYLAVKVVSHSIFKWRACHEDFSGLYTGQIISIKRCRADAEIQSIQKRLNFWWIFY